MAQLFGRDVKTIGKHINNALHEELAPVGANFAMVSKQVQGVAKNATSYVEQNQVVAKSNCRFWHGSFRELRFFSMMG